MEYMNETIFDYIGHYYGPNKNNLSLQKRKNIIAQVLNDPDLINVGFSNYQMCHETFALTRLCMFILTGKATVQTLNDGVIKRFWEKGTSPNRAERFKSVAEILSAVQKITDEDIEII